MGPVPQRCSPHGEAICIISCDQQKKLGAHVPVLDVIYEEWAGKGDQVPVERMSGIGRENYTSQGVPSGSAGLNLMAVPYRSELMTKESRVKFTPFISGKHIDRVHAQRAHILYDTRT